MINKNKDKGITLVALVITIIILLILATISIQSLTNTGLFQKANEAKEKMQNAEENQAKTLNEYEDELNKYISGTVEERKDPIKEVANKVLSTTDNTELQDAYGNKIVVPAGFKIVSDSTTSNATTVDKGIVIEDATTGATAGSQFVWIPVGKIYTDVAKTDANAKTIELGRYSFDYSTGLESAYSGSYVEEDANDESTLTNTENKAIAKNITNFKNSVTSNGGYYIGRYEARTTTPRTSADNALTQITEKITDHIYNYVTQVQSAQLSQHMYNTSKFTSDLINSYAWDTAIIFIQKCTNQTNYANQTSLNDSFLATGTSIDKQCNIFDMASNVAEFPTETSNISSNPCVYRGGYYSSTLGYTSLRDNCIISSSTPTLGFRPILYLTI